MRDTPAHPSRRRGVLVAAGPGLHVALEATTAALPPAVAVRDDLIGIALAVLVSGGGLLMRRAPRVGRALASAGILGVAGIAFGALAHEPAVVLALVLSCLALLAWIWPPSTTPDSTGTRHGAMAFDAPGRTVASTRAAAVAALVVWVASLPLAADTEAEIAALAASWLALALLSEVRGAGPTVWQVRPAVVVAAAVAIAGATALVFTLQPDLVPLTPALPSLLTLVAPRRGAPSGGRPAGGPWHAVVEHPERLLVATFTVTGLVGGFLLGLPISSAGAQPVAPLHALFTGYSATCVTGLIVVDTPSAWSGFGQGVILALIQVGGLGIMTFSTAALVLLGRPIGLRHAGAVAEVLGADGRSAIARALRQVLGVTFAAEAVGSLLLTVLFAAAGDPWRLAAWRGTFTAVSAYCNAGFALQTDSLIPYQQDGAVLLVIGALIVLGGLGPPVVVALPAWLARRRTSLHVRLVLWASALLLILPTILIAVADWRGSLAHLGPGDRLANAAFQALTPRTAGFNSLDLTTMSAPSITVIEALMFIGGSPGSTAGGAKTTTVALLLLAVVATLRGRPEVDVLGHRISHESVYRAAAVATLGAMSVLAALVALQVTQPLPFRVLLFEALSALGTVGLSLGATTALDEIGQVVVIGCMLLGRVGPLSVFLFLSGRPRRPTWQLPEERVAVG